MLSVCSRLQLAPSPPQQLRYSKVLTRVPTRPANLPLHYFLCPEDIAVALASLFFSLCSGVFQMLFVLIFPALEQTLWWFLYCALAYRVLGRFSPWL